MIQTEQLVAGWTEADQAAYNQLVITAQQLTGARPIGSYEPPEPARQPYRESYTPPALPRRPDDSDTYFGTRPIPHFDDEAAGPPLHLALDREVRSHRRPPEWRRRVGQAIGFLAGTASITAGVLLIWEGVAR